MNNRRELGSVSIFFITATAGFVLLTGLLIDYARVAAFRKQAELAVMSGTRSVLAAYDPYLYSRYGLFARGGDSADELFLRALEGNQPQPGGQAFSMLDMQLTASAAIESRPLATKEVLQRQVLEEMKYKAPIDLTIELVTRWKGVASVMKDAETTVDRLERMKQAYVRREASLDEAISELGEAGNGIVHAMDPILPSPPAELGGSRSAGGAATVPDVVLMYGDYVNKRIQDEQRAEAQRAAYQAWEERKKAAERSGAKFEEPPPASSPPLYAQQISAYLEGAEKVRKALLEIEAAAGKADSRLEKAARSLETARLADREMQSIAEEESDSGDTADDNDGASFSSDETSLREEAGQTFADLNRPLNELVLGDDWFDSSKQEIEQQRLAGQNVRDSTLLLAGTVGTIPGSSGLTARLASEGGQLQSHAESYRARYSESGTVMVAWKERVEEHRSADKERKQLEQEADKEWKKAVGGMSKLSGGAEESEAEAFRELETLYRANLEWNKAMDEAQVTEDSADNGEPVDTDESAGSSTSLGTGRQEALEKSSGWMSALSDAALGTRDRLYGSEYIIDRFVHSEPSEVKEFLEGSGELPASPASQQVEYILYGFANPKSNLAAAYSEIFAARFSIRMVEGLIESSKYGHPLVVLAAATLYAVRATVQDMQNLLSKGTVEFSKYVAFSTTYADYMRLFLLLHGGSSKNWSRMTAVMEQESGLSFERLYTYMSGQGTASVSLWFFPGLVKVLGLSGQWGGTVNGNRYEATYQADDAYQ
ncbi:hypothetical protein [Cohnella sp. AR92]|uniref:hypothetical protein n=1 Tax=Cohnella sp. AR92 TaxID=648716 RepID=UPI000F8EA0C5|nr:hypothetical protein [Cohnella sp. AR92]RUS45395.1 hypothetical protein ELR57_18700 [Cohnella sp. AR92]